ncbi:GDP-L-galactose phosphorylase 1-like [Andrographis paniculata]|uniref:GDP-L-galactose phosphorylase 1-like n=1 Tax=Andrographis paniculata TaxID=175694 RepID=UPI0021E96DBD|nr:GDP-L-galactose phosphorylase 1-like [Andrographis paniculata]
MERTLTIKRVPTVVSNYQESNASSEDLKTRAQDCGRHCLGNCCLPVSTLPLYAFGTADSDNLGCFNGERSLVSSLSNLLLGEWEDRMRRELFRYDIASCETKIISGEYGFVTQLNEGRHLKKRPTEFRVDKVLQPFDNNKFNFTKVGQEEVLFRFEPSQDGESHYFPSSPVHAENSSPSVVAINVSPIDYGHVLLIPHVSDCLPQEINHDGLLLALRFAKEASDPYFRVGYNSLGAFATINHLHFQAYYLAVCFPVEKSPTHRTMSSSGPYETRVIVSDLQNYPVRGLVFEGGRNLRDLSDTVASSCIALQTKNIAFNLLISDCGRRVFLLPQCYAEKQARGEVEPELLETQVNPAVWEISGHMVLKRRKDFDEATEQSARRLLAEVSLSEEKFRRVKAYVIEAANLLPEEDSGAVVEAECDVDSSCLDVASQHLPQDCLVLL